MTHGFVISREEFIPMLRKALASTAHARDLTVFPSLLVFLDEQLTVRALRARIPPEDIALMFFDGLHMKCEKAPATPLSFYPSGYPELLRSLSNVPPWIEVGPEDCDGDLSESRAAELRPLYWQLRQYGAEAMLARHEEWITSLRLGHGMKHDPPPDCLTPEEFRDWAMQFMLEDFATVLEQGACIAEDEYDDLVDAVFPYFYDPDEPGREARQAAGAPDLLVWDAGESLWFFAEIKGQKDSLRISQGEWLRVNWTRIRGNFVLVYLHVGDKSLS